MLSIALQEMGGGSWLLTVKGEADESNDRQLCQILDEARIRAMSTLIVDLSEVEHLHVGAFMLLFSASCDFRKAGKKFLIVSNRFVDQIISRVSFLSFERTSSVPAGLWDLESASTFATSNVA